MKRWKLAISLAVIAAVAAPAITGVWRLAPAEFEPLTDRERLEAGQYLQHSCITFPKTEDGWDHYDWEGCAIEERALRDGGRRYPAEPVTATYLAKNFYVVGGAFILTFALVMMAPTVGRRYWLWLRR